MSSKHKNFSCKAALQRIIVSLFSSSFVSSVKLIILLNIKTHTCRTIIYRIRLCIEMHLSLLKVLQHDSFLQDALQSLCVWPRDHRLAPAPAGTHGGRVSDPNAGRKVSPPPALTSFLPLYESYSQRQ